MRLSILILSSLVTLTYASSQINLIQNRKSLIPLNFNEAIKSFHNQLELLDNIKEFEFPNLNKFDIIDKISDLNSPKAPFPLPNVSTDCLSQLTSFALALSSRELWAIQVLDAFGKPPSGIIQGSFFWAGEYRECINITENTFVGKYCSLSKPQIPSMTPSASFKYGLCVPSFCNHDDIAATINLGISILPKNITDLLPVNLSFIDSSYVTCVESEPLDSDAILAIVIISILALLVLLGTAYDIFKDYSYKNHLRYINSSIIIQTDSGNVINNDEKEKIIKTYEQENESKLSKILLGFSLNTNAKKLFHVTKSGDQLQCLHAIRFLSIAWVVLGHTYVFKLANIDNILVITSWLKRFSFLIVSNAFFSVDSFFLLSGLLTSYLFLKETSKRKISVSLMAKYYFHRIWRLTPPYILVLMFSATLTKYLGTGPMYPKEGFEINKCHDTWWTNLLYVNNLVKTEQQCLAVSWYLANDMQFYFIAPLMLIPLALGKKILGFGICILLLVGNIITIALITHHYPGTEFGILGNNPYYFEKLYITPWCRIGPYIVGIILGYLILHFKKKDNFKIKFEFNLLLWLISLVTLGLMLFGIYPNLNGNPLSLTANILYQASSRIIWAIGLSYIIFACVTSHGGIVNSILSWSVWVPLSRLSYCLYLFHSVVILYYNAVQDHPIHIQDSNIIFNYIGNIVVSLACAFLVSMTFEVPLLGLEKVLLRKH